MSRNSRTPWDAEPLLEQISCDVLGLLLFFLHTNPSISFKK